MTTTVTILAGRLPVQLTLVDNLGAAESRARRRTLPAGSEEQLHLTKGQAIRLRELPAPKAGRGPKAARASAPDD